MHCRRCTSLDLPMAMRFRHLRTFAKEAVGVYRSNIHGRGLFCKRDIDASEMIIEYSGEVIRAILTDQREKHYESKAMGCYMFRKDRDHVIDSTMMGNAARFINHSCDPNCYSKVILVENRKHIVIFALRAIRRGEELTYDYKFPIEDVKIPCTCGSRRCRKYLNWGNDEGFSLFCNTTNRCSHESLNETCLLIQTSLAGSILSRKV